MQVTITVNLETIESGNAELLLCEARDFLEKNTSIKHYNELVREHNKAMKKAECISKQMNQLKPFIDTLQNKAY